MTPLRTVVLFIVVIGILGVIALAGAGLMILGLVRTQWQRRS